LIYTAAVSDHDRAAALSVGGRDPELASILDRGLDEYNFAATGTSESDRDSFSVKLTGTDGEIIGGLTAWTWAGLCGISMVWVHRKYGYVETGRTLGIPGGGEDVHLFKRLG
jgi:hypothetical protein